MYSYLVRYSAIACYITLGLGKINETFKEYHNSNVVKWIDDKYTTAYLQSIDKFKNSFFSVMSMDDRVKYCNEAKDFAGLDAITPISDTQLKLLADDYDEVLLECRTLPISYLRKRHANIIYIMMWENEFFNYHYEVQVTNSEPIIFSESTRSEDSKNMKMEAADLLNILRSTSFDNDRIKGVHVSGNMTIADFLVIIGSTDFADQRIKDNRLSQMEKGEPIQVCVAAKRHLRLLAGKDNDAQIVPVLQSDRVELAQIFYFGNEIGHYVALRCPSIPSMYVYFKDPTMPYSKDLQIVLVQN